MKTILIILTSFLLVLGNTEKQTPLAGPLGGKLSRGASPYIVEADIVIPAGETVVIEKGVTIHFNNFTGLIIRGTLIAEGSSDDPVVFTSVHDGTDNEVPAPYDWNGITIEEGGAGSLFRNCHIRYSLFGINSLTEFIVVDNCMFQKNGRADMTVKGVKYMAGTKPFSYLTYQKDGKTLIAYGTDVSDAKLLRNIGRYGGAVLFVAGVMVGVIEARKFRQADRQLDELNNVEEHIQDPDIISKWEKAKKDRDRHLSSMIFSFTFAGIGAAGMALSFTIDY